MEEIYCGINWTNDGVACHELVRFGEVILLPLGAGIPMPEGVERWCTGFYEFRNDWSGSHVPCRLGAQISSGHQCRDCRFREGFIALHRARVMQDVPPQLREYAAQEHVLYLATFGPGAIKIGTAARSRHPARWYEQGALAAVALSTVRDGIEVRRLESSLSRAHGLSQALRGSTKARLLASSPPRSDLVRELREVAARLGQEAGVAVNVDEVWHGALALVPDNIRDGAELRIVPAGSTEWDMRGDPDAVGQCLTWQGPTGDYVMDVKPLIGRTVTFASTGAGGTSHQTSLF